VNTGAEPGSVEGAFRRGPTGKDLARVPAADPDFDHLLFVSRAAGLGAPATAVEERRSGGFMPPSVTLFLPEGEIGE
jgi:hypothetical protein